MFAPKTYSKVSNSWGYGWWRREAGGYDPYDVSTTICQQTKTDNKGIIIEEHLTPSFAVKIISLMDKLSSEKRETSRALVGTWRTRWQHRPWLGLEEWFWKQVEWSYTIWIVGRRGKESSIQSHRLYYSWVLNCYRLTSRPAEGWGYKPQGFHHRCCQGARAGGS